MQLEGIVRNGVVVVSSEGALPEGARVTIVFNPTDETKKPIGASLLELAGKVEDWPSDMARNHDHYLHGAPRR